MAGVVETVGSEVHHWRPGDRVTVPFSIGCGRCASCRQGDLNTCDRAFTPGFTHWGSFAEFVMLDHADLNLVALPDELDSVHAAALGCRFITAFRAVVDRGRIQGGEWLAVHGCGGVGLSAVMIGAALGAKVAAVDIDDRKLTMAKDLGAAVTINATQEGDVAQALRDVADGGVHLSIDALGSRVTALASIGSLRKHGRHVQVGLLPGDDISPPIPVEPIVMREIEILGSRGMPATDYPRVLQLVASDAADVSRLVSSTVSLRDAGEVLAAMSEFSGVGITVIDGFRPVVFT